MKCFDSVQKSFCHHFYVQCLVLRAFFAYAVRVLILKRNRFSTSYICTQLLVISNFAMCEQAEMNAIRQCAMFSHKLYEWITNSHGN